MNVRDEGFLRNGIVFLDEAQAAKLDNVTVEKDDVLLNITGASVARVCLCPEAILPARVNQHVSIIRPKNMLLSPYIADLLKTPSMKGRLLQLAEAGATRQAITKAQIEKLAIPMPADDDLKAYARAINSHRSVRGQMAEAVTTAGQAFTSLQHRAFSGQL
jgi:restriction endonuclease S subunit